MSAPRLAFSHVKQSASGKWIHILPTLGIPIEALSGKHCVCPGCGGRDRFRFVPNDPTGQWFCGQGGTTVGGDGFALLGHVFAWSSGRALHEVIDALGLHTGANKASMRELSDLQIKAKAYALDEALLHQLTMLAMAIEPRVMGRNTSFVARMKKANPGYEAPPGEPWQTEEKLARQIVETIKKRYPKEGLK